MISAARQSVRSRGLSPRSWLPALIVTGLMLSVLLLTSGAPAAPGTSGRWVGRNLWTNGQLEASFALSLPGVTLGSPNDPGAYGMYAGVRAISEVTSEGSPVATAWFNGSYWNIGNLTASDRVAVQYSASVPVQGGETPRAQASVTVAYSIPPVPASSPGYTDIGVTVSVGHWPWADPTDQLEMLFPVWPSNATESHLASSAGGVSVDCLSNDTGAVLEYLAWNTTGQTVPSTEGAGALPAQANVTFVSPRAFVWVRFAATPSIYSGFEYAVTIGVFTPAKAPAPSAALDAGLLAASGTVIAALAVWMRALGKRAPSLLR